MGLDHLRKVSAEAKERQARERAERESNIRSDVQRQTAVEARWVEAKKVVAGLDETLERYASYGHREVSVYSISCDNKTPGFSYKQREEGFWNKRIVFDYTVPDYSQYVFDACQQLGLNPSWKFQEPQRGYAGGGYDHGGGCPAMLSLSVRW